MAKKQKLYPQEERKKDEEKHNREEMTHTQRELEDISGKFIETAERHREQTDPYEKKKKAQCRKNRKYHEVVLVITAVLIGFGAVAGLGYQIGSNSTERYMRGKSGRGIRSIQI